MPWRTPCKATTATDTCPPIPTISSGVLRHGLVQRKLALFRVDRALYEKIEEDS
jgi:hypothetical protein